MFNPSEVDVDGLSANAIDVKPIDFNFGEGFDETWEVVLPDFRGLSREALEAWLDDHGVGLDDREWNVQGLVRLCEATSCDEADGYTPMMNYAYPLPNYNGIYGYDQLSLEEIGSVCLVDIGGLYYLALTGGGMDLSQDICLGYIALGYLPPLHFCRLPDFAGQKLNARMNLILSACERTARISARRAVNLLEDISRHRAKLAVEAT